MLKEQDKIKELFSEKLGNYQAPVNSELWSSIASQIGTASTVAVAGTSVLVKVIIGSAAASLITLATYFAINPSENENIPTKKAQVLNNDAYDESKSTGDYKNNTPSQKINSSLGYNPSQKKEGGQHDQVELVNNGEISLDLVEKSDVRKVYDGSLLAENKQKTNVYPTNSPVSSIPNPSTSNSQVNLSGVNRDTKNVILSDKNNTDTQPVADEHKSLKKPLAEISETPDIFTPNGDNTNDELFINYSGELIDFSMVVLNMNNTTIFETKDPKFKWGGEMKNGELAPSGSYIYIIIARDANGVPINKYQRLTITR